MNGINSNVLIRGGKCLFPDGKIGEANVFISDGYIREILPVSKDNMEKTGADRKHTDREIDARGKTVVPGFIDIHTHPDKAFTRNIVQNQSGTLSEAIKRFVDYFPQVSEEDFYERGRRMFEMQAAHGTTSVRAHVTVSPQLGMKAFRAMQTLKGKLSGLIDIQLVAFPASPNSIEKGDETYSLLERAAQEGADAIGGVPNTADDHRELIDNLLDLAEEKELPVDFHVDESDEPDIRALEYLADAVTERGFSHGVTAGHCTSLSAVDDVTAQRVIDKLNEAGIAVVTLPSCNLYLMGRGDPQPRRRGVTRVHQLLENGVPVVYASDNIRDPFRPFGNGNMLEEGLLTAQVVQYGSDPQLLRILDMATYRAARIFGYSRYGVVEQAPADLLIYDASDPVEMLLSQSPVETVIKKGRILDDSESIGAHRVHKNGSSGPRNFE